MKTISVRVLCIVGAILALGSSAHADDAPWTQWRNALRPEGAEGPRLTLASDGKALFTIVVPEQATTQEQKAASDLAQWLQEMTGAEFPVVPDSTPANPKEISVGRTARLAEAELPEAKADLADEGYAIAVKGEKLFLLGGRKRGPIYAVYAFLEEDLGCRWYAGSSSTIPRHVSLTCRPMQRTSLPALMIRDPYYKVAFDGTWSLRNRTNAPGAAVPEEWGGRIDYALYVHTFNTLVPPGEYFEAHPEYFMMDDKGERNAHQLCTTNPDAIRIATESVLRILKEHPDSEVISVSKNDGGRTCLCENCKALDDAEGTNAAALLFMVNKVAEAVEKEHPDVVVSTLAYLETVKPPKTMRPRKNVAIRLCTDNCMWSRPFTPAQEVPAFYDAMTGWGAIHNRIHIWDYCVNFSHYTAPMPNMDAIADNIRFFDAHNAEGVMEQGAYQSPGAERDLMRAWVMSKLMWDPARDVWELMQDFIWGYFGPAAPAIAEYNVLLRQTGETHKESMKNPSGGIRYGMDDPFLTEDFLNQATALYDRAEKLAKDGEFLRRVELDRLPIMYVKLCRGPAFVGEGYEALLKRFEAIARREGLAFICEGAPDLDSKLAIWREML
jgi:Domain of unknown function (DUF4838)/Glycosyl hydrolase family 67 N-terminus